MRAKTDITIILDRSGSMVDIAKDTIGGFNTFLKDQQDQPGEASLSLVEFDNTRSVLFTDVDIKRVAPLTADTFKPSGGTALLDALGQTISDTGARLRELKPAQRPDKVVIVVFTDGEENSSKFYNRERVFEMIKLQRENYQWQFLFLAANQDAITVGAQYGFPSFNSITYGANPLGTSSVMSTLSGTVSNYRSGASGQSLGAFTKANRDEALGNDVTFVSNTVATPKAA